ncbi:MAG: beta-propeller domain-containing protein [Angustibacter sp.]
MADHDPRSRRVGRLGRRPLIGLVLSVILIAAGLTAIGTGLVGRSGIWPGSRPGPPTSLRAEAAGYTAFTGCPDLLGYLKKHARALVGPYGLPSHGPGIAESASARQASGADAVAGGQNGPGGAAAPGGSGARSQTGTTVQVAGVDEADIAKRVGGLIYTVTSPTAVPHPARSGRAEPGSLSARPALVIMRTARGRAEPLGRLAFGGWQPSSLLVEGDRVLLIGHQETSGRLPAGMPGRSFGPFLPQTRLVEVDVADPTAPRVVRSLVVDGSAVGVRLVGGVARVAVSGPTARVQFATPASPPDVKLPGGGAPGAGADEPDLGGIAVPPVPPSRGADGIVPPAPPDPRAAQQAERRATAANREAVERSRVEDWLPRFTLTDGAGSRPARSGPLLPCEQVSAPSRFAGLDTVSFLAFDLRDQAGVSRWDGAGVVASGAQLYATADHTFLATNSWQDWSAAAGLPADPARVLGGQQTQVHVFDTVGGAAPAYVGSGSVPGYLLDQFSMDAHDGYLRVASTSAPLWWAGAERVPSSSQVTVLRIDDDGLTRVGAVGGLGRTETIRSVRFLRGVGYVVTFRQTDPLYSIDLSEPARPRVVGELKIRGYSAYLHPAGDGLLLGVGQDATADGRTLGLQLTLFDVSDLAAPRRVDQVRLPGAWSDVEGDHHAFTFIDGLVLVPFSRWGGAVAAPLPGIEPGVGVSGDEPTPTSAGGLGYDAGVIAVRVTGDSGRRRFSGPTVLRVTGDEQRPPASPAVPGLPRPTPPDPALPDPTLPDPTLPDPTLPDPAGPPTPLRTFVDGGSIWTVTSEGVVVHDATTLRRTGFSRF